MTNGAAHIAAIISIPKTPTVLLSSSALPITLDAASDTMPPTTGSAVEMAVLAARSAKASALVVMAELIPRYAVKPIAKAVNPLGFT